MRNFLNQFPTSPMGRLDLEDYICRAARSLVPGYGGGQWKTKKVGKVVILLIPVENAKLPLTVNKGEFGGITTDYLTACAAFSSLVTNWYANARYPGRISDNLLEAISNYGYTLRGEVYADTQAVKLNASDFHDFTD